MENISVYLSIGTGEDETDTIEICNSTSLSNLSIAKKITEELRGIDLSTLYLQLCVEHKDKIAWSLYTTKTGIFEHWDGDQITENDQSHKGIMDTMRAVIGLLNNRICFLCDSTVFTSTSPNQNKWVSKVHSLVTSTERVSLITSKGEKSIFGFDDENLYTACGHFVDIQNARLRLPFP